MKTAMLVVALCAVMLCPGAAQARNALRIGGTAAADPATYVISGEINLPGRFPYISGMNVGDAIKRAGGMTSRGSAEAISILRFVNGDKRDLKATLDTSVRPDDLIRVGVPRNG